MLVDACAGVRRSGPPRASSARVVVEVRHCAPPLGPRSGPSAYLTAFLDTTLGAHVIAYSTRPVSHDMHVILARLVG